MNIHATIADDRTPEGWVETFRSDRASATREECEAQVTRIVNYFNAGLRGHEIPHRLLSIDLTEHSLKQAFKIGGDAYNSGYPHSENYFSEHDDALAAEWSSGWQHAEAESEED